MDLYERRAIELGVSEQAVATLISDQSRPLMARVCEFVEGVLANHPRGAVSPELDERDDETERRLLDRMERAGLLKDGMTATDAREALDA